jgi:hypothetical protein
MGRMLEIHQMGAKYMAYVLSSEFFSCSWRRARLTSKTVARTPYLEAT